MLRSLKLLASETGPLEIEMTGVTVFVGANSSGKSLALREIEDILSQNNANSRTYIVKDFDINWPSETEVDDLITKASAPPGMMGLPGHIAFHRMNPGGNSEGGTVDSRLLRQNLINKTDKGWIASAYIKWGVLRLDGRSRFGLTDDRPAGDLQGRPQNVLTYLVLNDDERGLVRRLVKDAFGVFFYIDPTNLGSFRIKLSNTQINGDEQSFNSTSRAFFSEARHIKDTSDGVQAYTGIVTAVVAGNYHTILVDEPEAFLHPPLARKLGRNLARLTADKRGSLIASTHSSDFLLGCVQGSHSVRVVRLEYSQGKSSARSIDPVLLKSFFKRPLMRSSNVISGLFHDGVVVVESDNDRVFYNEIYHRLLEENEGYPAILFVNAQNKQTIQEILKPMRQFGVPCVGIPDIDVVKDGGKTWTNWLNATNVPSAMHQALSHQRIAIDAALKGSGQDMKLSGGINILNEQDRLAANLLFDNLDKFGLFVVRQGELESWLPTLHVPGQKTDWTVRMLDALGTDKEDANYVYPSDGDVWDFMRRIVAWVQNPSRLGMSL